MSEIQTQRRDFIDVKQELPILTMANKIIDYLLRNGFVNSNLYVYKTKIIYKSPKVEKGISSSSTFIGIHTIDNCDISTDIHLLQIPEKNNLFISKLKIETLNSVIHLDIVYHLLVHPILYSYYRIPQTPSSQMYEKQLNMFIKKVFSKFLFRA
jgi:hypothetical protein